MIYSLFIHLQNSRTSDSAQAEVCQCSCLYQNLFWARHRQGKLSFLERLAWHVQDHGEHRIVCTFVHHLPDLGEKFIDILQIKSLRVELSSRPFQHPIMIWMVRIRDGLQECFVSALSAAVLWRCRSLSLQADGTLQPIMRVKDLLHHDCMLPAIAKIVFIADFGLLFRGNIG